MTSHTSLIPTERIEKSILLIRGQKIILDHQLAELYGVTTSRLNEQVKRNIERFPGDFMFQLSFDEFNSLISQFATSKGQGGRRKLPYAFTEQGVAMLSSVLRSSRAVHVNITIMRAFVQLRKALASHVELSRKLDALEAKYEGHDEKIVLIFEAIRKLMMPPKPKKRRKIGFRLE